MVYRFYTEKMPEYDVAARGLAAQVREFLGIDLRGARVFNRYDIEGADITDEIRVGILSEAAVDLCYAEELPELPRGAFIVAAEALPGQYDQRADSCAQCVEMVTRGTRPRVRTAMVYAFDGDLTDADKSALTRYLINPVESRAASLDKPATLEEIYPEPAPVITLSGFTDADGDALRGYIDDYGLAMDIEDVRFMQAYFRDVERRDPTITEVRLIDTYWSDHCRHTTFFTQLTDIEITEPQVKTAYDNYTRLRREVYGEDTERPVTLMDIATIGAKALRKRGLLQNMDISDEVNACSVHIDVDVDGKTEDWLLMFKNETHNHPTEVEPFGGAATCIGGAIRDPLAGRAYVYQAMRVTGAADPRTPVGDTRAGKLPQRKITTDAARGYSSYGNQIGVATGLVHEFYHPGYMAKRMELGAVVGAVKYEHVQRAEPAPGDVVILLGGRTGRDGIGGATGSSKSHNVESVTATASEVQKGNAPEERKIQRLFRDAEVVRMIKRCNDFGAGGVSVAIGELADGIDVDLSKVRKKYEGLDATELAISESQERMAVVVASGDAERFIALAAAENLEAYIVAEVTAQPRMKLRMGGAVVADLSREFLSSSGARKYADAAVYAAENTAESPEKKSPAAVLRDTAGDLRYASRRGLAEMFDASVGAGAVLAPYGGETQRTPAQVMAALIPVQDGETSTCSVMSFGFDPYLSARNPYKGAKSAVVTSMSKLAAAGVDTDKAYLSFQEYFERLRRDKTRWGKPLAALLGALDAQMELGAAAIGGKDSMSGSFMELDVPPTLVSFAVAPADARHIISPEFKAAGRDIVIFTAGKTLSDTKNTWRRVHELIKDGAVTAAWAVTDGGVADAVTKMSFGNNIGAELSPAAFDFTDAELTGAIVAEVTRGVDGAVKIGRTVAEPAFTVGGERVEIAELLTASEAVLEGIFPTRTVHNGTAPVISWDKRHIIRADKKFAAPRALILAFPGTNGEYDMQRAFERAGAAAEIAVVRNLTPDMLRESVARCAKLIGGSQIVAIPGGFSGGDEPDGSAKFITAFMRAPEIMDEIHELLDVRDGLMLGICNGFQALIKLGLVPYGRITAPRAEMPTLTNAVIGRHIARYAYTRVASVQSPWMLRSNVGDVYALPLSHGEGRFVAPRHVIENLIANGQIASQYSDADGTPAMDVEVNPNGSMCAVEGVFSPDGRVFGKMGHSERRGEFVGRNIGGEKHQPLFDSAVLYYR